MIELAAYSRARGVAADEDWRREMLEEQRREDKLAREAERQMTADQLGAVLAEALERARADDLATYGRVPCPECGAPAGRACAGRDSSHYARAVSFVQRGAP